MTYDIAGVSSRGVSYALTQRKTTTGIIVLADGSYACVTRFLSMAYQTAFNTRCFADN